MSYILDALRRAEADRERERGAVPGLHSPALPADAALPARAARAWLPWAGAGTLLLAGLAGGWWWADSSRETPPAPAPLPPAAAAPAPAAAAPAPVPTAPSAPAVVAATMAGPPASATSPYLPPAPPPVTVATPAPAATPALTRPPAAAPQARLPLVSELPEATRRALPRLAFGGSVYSDDPASRLVIVNGEVQREGAALANDLVLEQIRPRELVLRFQGLRYRQPL